MTDDQIWWASLAAGTLAGFAYTQALPHVTTAASWSKRTRIIVGAAIFLLTSAGSHLISNAYFGITSGGLTKSRDTEQKMQDAGNDMEERIKTIEGR